MAILPMGKGTKTSCVAAWPLIVLPHIIPAAAASGQVGRRLRCWAAPPTSPSLGRRPSCLSPHSTWHTDCRCPTTSPAWVPRLLMSSSVL
jgi:hypothetical protein